MALNSPATPILNGNPIRPRDSADPGEVAWSDEVKGGHHQKDTLAERDAITVERRKIGMLCTVAEAGKTYRLVGTLENSGWTDILGETDQRAAALEEQTADLDVRVASVEQSQANGHRGYLTRSALYADLTPADSTVAEVTNDPDPNNNGTYIKLGASGTGSWQQSSNGIYGDVSNLKIKTDNVAVENPVYVRGREALEVAKDGQGSIATSLAKDGTLTVARLDAVTLANPDEINEQLGLEDYPSVAATAANVTVEDDVYINGGRALEVWRDGGGKITKALMEDGEMYAARLRVGGFANLAEVKDELGIGIVPGTIAEVALAKYNSGNVLTPWEALAMAAHRKIDVVGVWDSNGLHSGDGWDAGFTKAFEARWRMHSSPLYFTQRTSVGYTTASTSMGSQVTPPASPYESYFITSTSLADGVIETDGAGIIVDSASKLDVNSALRWECLYATMTAGSGTFTPRCRMEVSPYTGVVTGTPINTNTGVAGVARATLDIPAGTRNYDIKAGAQCGPTTATGPVIMFCERLIDTLTAAGFSMSVWMAEAGKSLEDMLGYAQAYNRSAAIAFFTELRRVQAAAAGKPIVVFIVNSGVNDRNAVGPSRGWKAIADGDSPEAYVDNLEGLMDFVETIWESQGGLGWSVEEVYWIIIPSHRIADPDNAELVGYRQAVRSALSKRQRCAVVDLGQITTYAEGVANGWYQPGDPIHGTFAGHQAWAERILVNHGL